jgi:hypothetical protein
MREPKGESFMKIATPLVTALFALASSPLLAQQRPTNPPNDPTTQAPQSPDMEQAAPDSTPGPRTGRAAPSPAQEATAAPAAQLSPVNGELISKLDSKTAKAGDSVVVQTKAAVKTADGTNIPKGSKLVGHVLAVQPSNAGENSQVALQFDHFELKGGQNLPVQSQIQSIAPAGGAASADALDAPTRGIGGSPAAASSDPSAANGSRASSTPPSAASSPQPAPGPAAAPAGTLVGKTGNIAIRTTSIPGVLLANNAPGQQDPRMAQASSILLGAKQDIQLSGGTEMVLGVAAASGGAH